MIFRPVARVISVALLGAPFAVSAEHPVEPFAWKQALSGAIVSGACYRATVPTAVFDGCRRFPDDLRIVDREAREWPFFVWQPRPRVELRRLPARRLNLSMVELPDRYYRQDFQILADPGRAGRPRHNQVIIRTSGQDFIRRVEVLGSEDQVRWGLLGEGYLIDHARAATAQNRVIRYPDSDFPFIQVRIYPNVRDPAEKLEIIEITPVQAIDSGGAWEQVEATSLPASSAGMRSELFFDTGAVNRPVERIRFEVREAEYARCLSVYGRNTADGAWRWVADAEIHRLGADVNETVPLRGFSFRFIRLVIHDDEAQPLDVQTVTFGAVPRYLVLEARGDAPAALYYGAAKIGPGQYDLEREVTDETAASLPVLQFGPREPNEPPVLPGWLARGRGPALVVIGGVSLAVLWVILSMMKRMT